MEVTVDFIGDITKVISTPKTNLIAPKDEYLYYGSGAIGLKLSAALFATAAFSLY